MRLVSIVLPTFNEAGNIVKLVHSILDAIPADWSGEVFVMDDSSPDETAAVARRAFADDIRVHVVTRTSDRGFARSIRDGIERASGERIVVMDTDLTHDPGDIPKMLHVCDVYDLVSASRFCAGGSMHDTRHYLASLAFNWYVRIVLRTQIQDNLGGYFAVRATKLRDLPFDRIFFGYGEYFFRLLHYAQRAGFDVVELPSQYRQRHSGASKSRFFQMIFTYSGALFRLRRDARRMREHAGEGR